MSHAIETLMGEHRIIEKVLDSLEVFSDQLQPHQPDARRQLAEYAEFFREFVDHCHHGKEEQQLFAALADHGFPRNAGPLFVMVGEHNMGRLSVATLTSISAGEGALSDVELDQVRSTVRAFVPVLRMHIQKEDQILFPAAERALPDDVLDQLAAGFEEFERTAMGEGAHQRLHALGERLIDAGSSMSAV